MFNFRNINLLKALKRFPFACGFAIVATCIGMYLIDFNKPPVHWINVMLTCMIGGIANIALTVAIEAHKISTSRQLIYRGIALLTLVAFYFLFLPDSYDVHNSTLFRLPFQIASIFFFLHLLISFLPFINKGSEEDFWEYNKDVFLNFVESMFYAFFLFAGLSIALLALDNLFGIDMDSLAYPRLFFFLVGIFNTLYFLSKYPEVYYDNHIKTPIKAFLIFSQYILIPLVLIYMTILYAYGIQIGFKWELPKGWVSQLSLWFSVVGIFAFLLNYFNHKFSDFKLTAYYKKYFFPVLLVPVVLVFIAIYRRISEYGVTELRYVVALLGFWLLGIALYFNFSKRKNIRIIPISLSLIVFIPILLGPFNMFNATLTSQKKHFKNLLIDNGCLIDQKLVPIDDFERRRNSKMTKIDQENQEEELQKERTIFNAIRFLNERSDLSFINDWIEPDLPFVKEDDPRVKTDSLDRYHNERILTEKLNISSFTPLVHIQPEGKRFTITQESNQTAQLDSNRFFVPIDIQNYRRNNATIYFKLNEEKTGLVLYKKDTIVGEIFLEKYIKPQMGEQESPDSNDLNYSFDNPTVTVHHTVFNATLVLTNIGGVKTPEGKLKIDNIWGHAIIEFKPTQE